MAKLRRKPTRSGILTPDLKIRIAQSLADGMSRNEILARFDIAPKPVTELVTEMRRVVFAPGWELDSCVAERWLKKTVEA